MENPADIDFFPGFSMGFFHQLDTFPTSIQVAWIGVPGVAAHFNHGNGVFCFLYFFLVYPKKWTKLYHISEIIIYVYLIKHTLW